MSTQDLVAKLWNLCNVLRDDGITYHEYINELTYLIFLKMAQETDTEDRLPQGYRWQDLNALDDARIIKACYQKMKPTIQPSG